ncbi:hypothetical protein BGX38DRAFT_1199654 [Terfezia claveryi]|nr:hypothetical protein BGX38DRAFT_1199654 [Terfezia claveryi]
MPRATHIAAALTAIVASRGPSFARAHEHHEQNIPEGSVISPDPLDTILWLHVGGMIASFGIIFPIGMVLGIVKNRWHVPTQVVGAVVAILSWFLGHNHGGRQFAPNIHASFASTLMSLLMMQIGVGVYLKLHMEKGIHGKVRKKVVLLHGVLGKVMPVVAWVQMLFGGITALGFCRDSHTGNCIAHFIMGSSFIGYGTIMILLTLQGQRWLRSTGKSQEFWDSLVITCWGIINTFTEHRWGQHWEHNDIQHTSMGIVWWATGMLGLWLSWSNNGQPRRNVIPGIVIILTGYAMSAHTQHSPLSGAVHTVFGYTLMAAGLARVVEIAFVCRDRSYLALEEVSSWQYLSPYLLFAAGFIFQAANEEQIALVSSIGIDHVSYILVLYSLASVMFLFVNILITIYAKNPAPPLKRPVGGEGTRPNGHARPAEVVDDVQQFELEGLISDSDEERLTSRRERRSSVERH